MDSHTGFTDSDDELTGDEITGSYHCSDPDHCDRDEDCDGEHTYSTEYYRLRGGEDEVSEDKSEITVDGKPQSPADVVVIDDCEDDDDTGGADPRDMPSVSGDDDPNYDSEDECSCS